MNAILIKFRLVFIACLFIVSPLVSAQQLHMYLWAQELFPEEPLEEVLSEYQFQSLYFGKKLDKQKWDAFIDQTWYVAADEYKTPAFGDGTMVMLKENKLFVNIPTEHLRYGDLFSLDIRHKKTGKTMHLLFRYGSIDESHVKNYKGRKIPLRGFVFTEGYYFVDFYEETSPYYPKGKPYYVYLAFENSKRVEFVRTNKTFDLLKKFRIEPNEYLPVLDKYPFKPL